MSKTVEKWKNEQVTEQESGKIYHKLIMVLFFILSIDKDKKIL